MSSGKISPLFISWFAFLIPLAMGSPVRADLVLGFPNGLTGWSTPNDGSAQGDPGTVTASGGLATITESTFAAETDLFLNFTVPTGAQSLQFTFNSAFPDSAPSNGVTPDAFGASLLDPNTLSPLVPTVPDSDSFYTRDIVDPLPDAVSTNQVTFPTAPPGVLAVVSLDLSTQGLDGQSAEILFRLIGGTDPLSTSTVTISNVEIITGAAVPEPSSIVSGLTAALVLAGVFATRSLRKASFVSG